MMHRWMQRARHGRAGEDGGVALLAAIALVAISGTLMITMVAYALREARSTGRDRQRSEAVQTAEGAVDLALAKVQNTAPAALPCGASAPTVAAAVADQLSISTTVTYYDAAGATIPCAGLPTTVATRALVKATSTSSGVAGQSGPTRTVESLVALTPTYANGLDKAIFGNTAIQLSNRGEIFGEPGKTNADVYTNGNFICNNNQRYHGSVFAQGSISLASTCTIDDTAWARLGFTAQNPGVTVSGDVRVSQGDAHSIQQATIGGRVFARTTSGQFCTTYPSKCSTGAGVTADPPTQAFPAIPKDAYLAWAAAPAEQGGPYLSEVTKNDCTLNGDSNEPGKWIMDNAAALTQPTILRTRCQVIIQRNNNTIALGDNLGVFAEGGVSFRNSLTIRSTTAAQRYLYLIQPSDSLVQPSNSPLPSPCTTDGIVLDNRVTIESTVSELIYTPCNVRKANNSDHYGQIYAGGTATIDNSLTMYYRPLPVWGVVGPTTTVTSYALDIQYKRENL